MGTLPLPEPIASFLTTLTGLVDARQANLLAPLFQGILFAHGRRTATTWFAAGDIADDFRRAYHLLGTLGRDRIDSCSGLLFSRLRRAIDPGPRGCSPSMTPPRSATVRAWRGPASTTTPPRGRRTGATSTVMSG